MYKFELFIFFFNLIVVLIYAYSIKAKADLRSANYLLIILLSHLFFVPLQQQVSQNVFYLYFR